MANPAVDPKAAPLADDLKELALYVSWQFLSLSFPNHYSSLPTTAFPKNLFCALCNELAIDSYKLLCCNKAICSLCTLTKTSGSIQAILILLQVRPNSNSQHHVRRATTRLSR